jgi:hypothetical protein
LRKSRTGFYALPRMKARPGSRSVHAMSSSRERSRHA